MAFGGSGGWMVTVVLVGVALAVCMLGERELELEAKVQRHESSRLKLTVEVEGAGAHRLLTLTGHCAEADSLCTSGLLLIKVTTPPSLFFDDDELQRKAEPLNPHTYVKARSIGHIDIEAPAWTANKSSAWAVTQAVQSTPEHGVHVQLPFHTRYCLPHPSSTREAPLPVVPEAHIVHFQTNAHTSPPLPPGAQLVRAFPSARYKSALQDALHRCPTVRCVLDHIDRLLGSKGAAKATPLTLQQHPAHKDTTDAILIPVGSPAHQDAVVAATHTVIWAGVAFVLWLQWWPRPRPTITKAKAS